MAWGKSRAEAPNGLAVRAACDILWPRCHRDRTVSRLASITLCLLIVLGGGWAVTGALATPRDEDLFIRPIDQRWTLFASADIGSSVFLAGGSKQALVGPLDRPGFLLLESTGIGLTRERARFGDAILPVDRFTHQASMLGGYQTMLGPLYLAAYAGPELQHQQIAYDGRFSRLSQPRLGLRGQFELWYNPTPDTLATATLVASSAATSFWGRASTGIRLFANAYIGPEVTFYATPTYREARIGGHLTGAAIGIVNLRLSGGIMTSDGRRSAFPYIGFSAWMRL